MIDSNKSGHSLRLINMFSFQWVNKDLDLVQTYNEDSGQTKRIDRMV